MRIPATPMILAALAFLPGPGCGSGAGAQAAPTVPVKGKVTFKGQPVTQGTVVFEPDGGREAHGEIQPDGSFMLTTFNKDDGAVPGTHRVAVTGAVKSKPAFPLKYKNPSSSKVEVEVTDGKIEYDIDFK